MNIQTLFTSNRLRMAVAVLAFVIVGIAIWLIVDRKQEVPQDIYAGWASFEDKDLGVKFRYPEGWKAETVDSGKTVSLTSAITQERITGIERQFGKGSCTACGPNVTVSGFDKLQDDPSNAVGAETLEQLVEQDKTKQFLGRAQIGPLVAVEVQQEGPGAHYVLYLEKDGRFYKVYFAYQEDRDSLTAEEKKIVSSLEIIR